MAVAKSSGISADTLSVVSDSAFSEIAPRKKQTKKKSRRQSDDCCPTSSCTAGDCSDVQSVLKQQQLWLMTQMQTGSTSLIPQSRFVFLIKRSVTILDRLCSIFDF